ncbi:unnamed protein product [[Candida] boidinii]|nr:unnamed protein product [[Candida] boidinii]
MTSRVVNGSPGYGEVSHIKLLQDPFVDTNNNNKNSKNNLFGESESKHIDTKENKIDDNNNNKNNIIVNYADKNEACDSFKDTCDDTSSSYHCSPIDSENKSNVDIGNKQVSSPKSESHPRESKEHRSLYSDEHSRPASEWIRDIKNFQVYKIFGDIVDVIDTPTGQTTLCPTSSSNNSFGFSDSNKNKNISENKDITKTIRETSDPIDKIEILKNDGLGDDKYNLLPLVSPVMQTNPLSDDDSILVSDTDSEVSKIRRCGATRFLKIKPQTLENVNYVSDDCEDDFNKTPTDSPIRTPICSPIKQYYDSSDNESEIGQGQIKGKTNYKNSPRPRCG